MLRPGSLDVTTVVTPPPRRAVAGFERWVAASIPAGGAVLNIGGGCDDSGELRRVRRRAGRLVVVDPSERVRDHGTADERHQCTLEEFAQDHRHQFDLAFAVFVLEHVSDPRSFTRAAADVLRPGGAFMALTVNQWHYFGLTGLLSTRLGISEWLLPRVRDPDALARYHVPTEYRLNSMRKASVELDRAGFSAVEYRMWDLPSMYRPYLPGALSGLADVWHKAAYQFEVPNLMGHLTFKATYGRVPRE